MIRCYLSKILGDRRIKIVELSRETGINRGTLMRLYHEKAERVDLAAVSTICEYLDCRVEDLFEYIPDSAKESSPENS